MSGPCPSSEPTAGAPCSKEGLVCEWGSSPVPSCDHVETCTGGVWVTTPESATYCMPAGGSKCPPSFASMPTGAACGDVGTYCDYPQGRCGCTFLEAGGDQWQCTAPDPGCPSTRPALGSSCSQAGMDCDYGSCLVPGGVDEQCTGGVWVQVDVGCTAVVGPRR